MIAAHYAVCTAIQGMNCIQTWLRPVHGRLAVLKQPYRKQGPGYQQHEINLNAINILVNVLVCISKEDIQAVT